MFGDVEQVDVTICPGAEEPHNLEPRVHASMLLDLSGSMALYAKELPGVWRKMATTLNKRTVERLRIELACCAFDGRVVYQDYAPVPYYLDKPLTFEGGGFTALGTALLTVIEHTQRRRHALSSMGVHCYRSMCLVVSDGFANDGNVIESAIEEIRKAEERRQIRFVPLAPDPECVGQLETIFGKGTVLLLPEVRFDILFAALARSLSRYSQSAPGFEPDAREVIRIELGQSPRVLTPHPETVRRIGYEGP